MTMEAGSSDLGKEWNLNPRRITRDRRSMSRRFSASNITTSFREEENGGIVNGRSFRSNIAISSTASSPGCNLNKDEIDHSTYSFSTALRALQARSGFVWDHCYSPEGFGFGTLALNSKWSEAERYICNPLSGEFPLECLSSNILTGRSGLHNLIAAGRITMSAPLVYSSNHPSRRIINFSPKQPLVVKEDKDQQPQQMDEILKIKGFVSKKNTKTRDVGTQSSISPDYSSSSNITPAPASASSSSASSPTTSKNPSFDPDGSSHMESMEQEEAMQEIEDHEQKEVEHTKASCCTNAHDKLQKQQYLQHLNKDDTNNKKKIKYKAIMVTRDEEGEEQQRLCRCSNGCLLGSLSSSWRSFWMRKNKQTQFRENNQQQPT